MSAQVIEYDQIGMSVESRCDRCGKQAYGEALLFEGTLLFCAHHLSEHLPKLREVADTIADHRKFLHKQEKEQRDTASAV